MRKNIRNLLGGEDLLDTGLRIVKIATHRADVYIAALLRHHLQALCLADAALGIEYQHARSGNVLKPFQRGLARVTRCSDENIDLLGLTRLAQGIAHQMREHLQGNILKRHRRPVP